MENVNYMGWGTVTPRGSNAGSFSDPLSLWFILPTEKWVPEPVSPSCWGVGQALSAVAAFSICRQWRRTAGRQREGSQLSCPEIPFKSLASKDEEPAAFVLPPLTWPPVSFCLFLCIETGRP